MIDKNSPIPLYYQIKEDIIAEIEANELKEGQKIAGEHEFVQKYGVSQITIRKALSDLVTEGYLTRVRGKGTFISNKRNKHKTSFISFTDEMKQLGYQSSIHLLEVLSESKSRILKKLNMDETESYIKIKRVRLGNGEPFGLQTSYIPTKYVSIQAFENFSEIMSLYQVLQGVGIQPKRIREKYRAVLVSNPKTQKLLGLPSELPAFYVERYGYNQDDNLFEYTESILRGDRYELETEISENNN